MFRFWHNTRREPRQFSIPHKQHSADSAAGARRIARSAEAAEEVAVPQRLEHPAEVDEI